ncbi:MAG: peptide chain release factor N(5)-glutamine methyltransferase [Provencibacterium sp.]|jgi:release factor glutamine methyltransferase|nr:peptide chain release factor N(5)-glutamine methyltransferase [Provencibacterium sp.]
MPPIDRLLREGTRALQQAGIPSPLFDARELLMHALGLSSRMELYRLATVEENAATVYRQLILRRAQRYPLQYLLGFWEFYGRRFSVREGVLIPRADTECLIDCALQAAGKGAAILDLCSGTGAIAITLALEIDGAQVDALELSPSALEVLRENVQSHRVSIRVLSADALTYLPDRLYSLITCNPPYIDAQDYAHLQPEVLHEPEMALVADHNGFAFYEVVTERYRDFLLPGGLLLFEVGVGQAETVRTLLANAGYQNVFSRLDVQGIERVVGGYL